MKRTVASRGLRPSIPDNGDWPRRFRGWTDFTRCADVKQAAAPRNLRSTIPDNDDYLRCFCEMGGFPALCGRETGCRFAGFYVQPFRTTVIVRDAFAGWANFLRRADVKQTAASRSFTFKHSGQRRFRRMDGFSFPRGRYVQAFRTTIRLLRSVCTVRRTFRRMCGAGFSYL